jgi:hypothetical protein
MERMKGKLTNIWPTFIKETPQMSDYSETTEPREQLELVQQAWEVLTNRA